MNARPDEFELRPVQRKTGEWDALDEHGHGYALGLKTKGACEVWIAGYNAGAEDNA